MARCMCHSSIIRRRVSTYIISIEETKRYLLLPSIYTNEQLNTFFVSVACSPFFFLLLSRAVLLVVIVEKSKKCLDFSVTLFFVHLVFSTMYNHGIPKAIEWWLVHVAGTILMVVLGEYLCSRREMEDIPLLHL
jgi:hypothetical protein